MRGTELPKRVTSGHQQGAASIVDFGKAASLFCPVLFDLGETMSVAVVSVTEGVGKLAKYPHMFQGSYLIVPNKVECRAFATGNAVSSGVPRS